MTKIKTQWLALFTAMPLLAMTAPLQAQSVIGSGVPASTTGNSQERAIGFAEQMPATTALIILTQSADLPDVAGLSVAERSSVEAAIAAEGFKGKEGQSLKLRGIGQRPLIMIAGAAKPNDKGADWRAAAGSAVQILMNEEAELTIAGAPDPAAMAEAALGLALGKYRFDRYQYDVETRPASQKITIAGTGASEAQTLWDSRYKHLAEGVRFVRDLQSEPANALYPQSFVERTRAAFTGVPNIKIEVLDEAAMRKLNMGAIVGVG
ncbi:MAG: M17 family peptidase N-terminal domain-containing protein, partial [Parasphingorhabdus sp.]